MANIEDWAIEFKWSGNQGMMMRYPEFNSDGWINFNEFHKVGPVFLTLDAALKKMAECRRVEIGKSKPAALDWQVRNVVTGEVISGDIFV